MCETASNSVHGLLSMLDTALARPIQESQSLASAQGKKDIVRFDFATLLGQQSSEQVGRSLAILRAKFGEFPERPSGRRQAY